MSSSPLIPTTEKVDSPTVRIVACQGAVQLASAIAAMRTTRDSGLLKTQLGNRCVNHLFIHDLSAPEGQIDEFAVCIRDLAEKLENWGSIHIIKTSDVVRIQGLIREKKLDLTTLFAQEFGLTRCDELYVGQNNKNFPVWLRQAMPNAWKTCFGDGIALNFTNSYFRPKEFSAAQTNLPWFKKAERKAKSLMRSFFSRSSVQDTAEKPFDSHCLLLKNLFDEHLDSVLMIDPQIFRDVFDIFGEDFKTKAPETHSALVGLNSVPGHNVVLLTSNFSETGRMSIEGEIRGYCKILEDLPRGESVALVIKPHPRDSYEKIQRIQSAVKEKYDHVLALSDPWTFYLPFESLYARYLAPINSPLRETHVATVSSACISLEYLYSQRCSLGFGKDIVDQEFTAMWQELRNIHERDLVRIIAKIQKGSRSRVLSKRAA
ncbi:polysialyltransferase family glycosyltransferase [Pirellulaceae bacterium SH449]